MLETKNCHAFVEALAYWNSGNLLRGRGKLVEPEKVVETRTSIEQLMRDLGAPVNVDTPAGWLHSWPNVQLGGRLGILFAMDFGKSCAVHFAALPEDQPRP